MMLIATGFVRRHNHTLLERADVFETRKGTEFARTPDGLILMPGAYDWAECYEVESDDDVVEVEAMLQELGAAGALG